MLGKNYLVNYLKERFSKGLIHVSGVKFHANVQIFRLLSF